MPKIEMLFGGVFTCFIKNKDEQKITISSYYVKYHLTEII